MKEHLKKIGKTVSFQIEPDFYISVVVEDVRTAFGRIDYLIRPVAGSGSKWVNAERVKN